MRAKHIDNVARRYPFSQPFLLWLSCHAAGGFYDLWSKKMRERQPLFALWKVHLQSFLESSFSVFLPCLSFCPLFKKLDVYGAERLDFWNQTRKLAMNRSYQAFLARHQAPPPIVVHDHDVLSGRGVNISHHPGNQRFRTLVTTRADENYCTHYSASEKRAVAEEIIKHIKELNPPGRFLRREGRGHSNRGLTGPWQELTEREAIKKTVCFSCLLLFCFFKRVAHTTYICVFSSSSAKHFGIAIGRIERDTLLALQCRRMCEKRPTNELNWDCR